MVICLQVRVVCGGGEPADGAFYMCLLHWPFLVEEVTGWGGGFFKELRRVTTEVFVDIDCNQCSLAEGFNGHCDRFP